MASVGTLRPTGLRRRLPWAIGGAEHLPRSLSRCFDFRCHYREQEASNLRISSLGQTSIQIAQGEIGLCLRGKRAFGMFGVDTVLRSVKFCAGINDVWKV